MMNARALKLTIVALLLSISASAVPNPNPIDAGTAHAVAINDDLACSTGSCGLHNSTVAETEETNSTSSAVSNAPYSSGTLHNYAWAPLSFFAAGGLVFSTGML